MTRHTFIPAPWGIPIIVCLVAVLLVLLARPAAADQPGFICEGLDSGKVDTVGDPATVTVTAPAGFLIDGYCVKAGTEKFWVDVIPAAASVVVDHPVKDSVSHYSLSYVAIVSPTSSPTPTPTLTATSTSVPCAPDKCELTRLPTTGDEGYWLLLGGMTLLLVGVSALAVAEYRNPNRLAGVVRGRPVVGPDFGVRVKPARPALAPDACFVERPATAHVNALEDPWSRVRDRED